MGLIVLWFFFIKYIVLYMFMIFIIVICSIDYKGGVYFLK